MKLRHLLGAVGSIAAILVTVPAFAVETVSTIAVGPPASVLGKLEVHAGKIFFATSDAQGDLSLSVSDGTPAGTKVLAKLASGSNGATRRPIVHAMLSSPAGMLVIAEDLQIPNGGFTEAGEKLWVSDGTAAGTRLVTTLPRDLDHPSSPVGFTMQPLGAKTLLVRRTVAGTSYTELLTTDGTAAGTAELGAALRSDTYAVAGAVYFVGLEGEIHRTDGQADTTPFTFADRAPGQPTFVDVCGGALYVTYKTAAAPWRMMRYDGVAAPAEVGVLPADASATPGGVCASGTYYFFPPRSSIGREPWVVEGGAARLLADAAPGSDSFTLDTYNAPVALAFGSRLVMPAATAATSFETRLYLSNASNTAMQTLSNDDARYFTRLGTAGGRLYYALGLGNAARVFSTDGVGIAPVALGTAGPPAHGGVTLGSKLIGWAMPSGSPATDSLWILDTAPSSPPDSGSSGGPGPGDSTGPAGAPADEQGPDSVEGAASGGEAAAGQSGCATSAGRGLAGGLAPGAGVMAIALVLTRRARRRER
jgi:ELWxxDGT repeat protein